MDILNRNNFNSDGSLNFKSLTIQQCFDLYRHYFNEWVSSVFFCRHYHMNEFEFNQIKAIHNYIDSKLTTSSEVNVMKN